MEKENRYYIKNTLDNTYFYNYFGKKNIPDVLFVEWCKNPNMATYWDGIFNAFEVYSKIGCNIVDGIYIFKGEINKMGKIKKILI